MTENSISSFDTLEKFIFNDLSVRGAIAQTQVSYKELLSNHNYPKCLSKLLGEMQAAICLLSSTLKIQGKIMLQITNAQKFKYAVLNSTHLHETRGMVAFDYEIDDNLSFKELMGEKAILTLTIFPDNSNHYQGSVLANKDSLSACLEEYYNQSMQIDTKIYLFNDTSELKSAGLLLQILPCDNKTKLQADFEHLTVLADTITQDEMLTLNSIDIIYRLFNQENINVFPNQSISFKCNCSHEHFATMLSYLNPDELASMAQEKEINTCECNYCGKKYDFTREQLLEVLKNIKSR